jgi:hypothetical protein
MKAGCADNSRLPVESGPLFKNPRECASVQLTCNRQTVDCRHSTKGKFTYTLQALRSEARRERWQLIDSHAQARSPGLPSLGPAQPVRSY